MREKICHIVGSAAVTDLPIRRADGDLVLAADGGYSHLLRFGIHCDAAIGDFDSLGYTPAGDAVRVFPAEKDYTDLILAAEYGLERGYGKFALYGCLGGALSHTLGNVQALAYLQKKGATGALFGDGVCCRLVAGALTLSLPTDMKVSVFAFGGAARGVTLAGFQYPLNHAVMTTDEPIGVSNVPVAPEVSIEVKTGALCVVFEGSMKEPLELLL